MTADRQRLTIWTLFFFAALLLHVALFSVGIRFPQQASSPRVEIQQVNPKQLEAVRRQWRAQDKTKPLLLNKDKSIPNEAQAPDKARYMSDRNHSVEREQRARQAEVMPKAGTPGAQEKTNPQPMSPPKVAQHQQKPSARTRSPLGKLGLPFHLAENSPTQSKPYEQPNQTRAGQAGSEQALLDRTVPEGSENLLNTEQSVYYSFYSRLYEAIGPVWESRIREVPYQRSVQEGEYTTVVDVIFDAEGNLVGVQQSQSSGVPEFDSAVEQSWRRIGRFPNPPKGLLDPQGQVHTGWTFSVQVGAGFNLNYLPPQRAY